MLHDAPFDFDDGNFEPCEDSCFVCTGEWKKIFRPIHQESLVAWLQSPTICDVFPIMGTPNDIAGFCNKLTTLLWNSERNIQAIFDIKKSSITKAQIGCFFLQLIAADIISIDVTSVDTVRWRLSRVEKWFDRTTGEATTAPTQQNNVTPVRNSRQLHSRDNVVKRSVYKYTLEESWSGVHK